jgi:hypothetical protein
LKDEYPMKKLLFTLALGAMAASAPALAQPVEAPPPPSPGVAPAQPAPMGGRGGFMKDQTRAEAQQRADRLFQMLDANHDGVVTRAEAEQAASMFAARRGGEGGSGRMERLIDQEFGTAQSLTLQQFEAQALAHFDALDLNHDGVVTAAERQQARAAMRGQEPPRQ